MASRHLNEDIVAEILSHLSVQCLFKFRTTCKAWRGVIDSPSFRKSQIANYKNDREDDTSIILFKYFLDPLQIWGSSIIFRDTRKSYDFPCLGMFVNGRSEVVERYLAINPFSKLRIVGPVTGLICIHSIEPNGDIAVCNPCFDQLKALPVHSICSQAYFMDVGISYDSVVDDYKVVKLLSCTLHCCLHVSIYSKKENIWRELANSNEYLSIQEPIISSCSNGAVAHWRVTRFGIEDLENMILSFDMKTEVFRSLEMLDYERLRHRGDVKIYYEKGGTFFLIILDYTWLHIYEGMFEGNNRVVWHHVKRVGVAGVLEDFLWRSGCVVFHEIDESDFNQSRKKLIVYDYCAEKIVGRIELPIDYHGLKVFEYDGSFVSP